MGRPKKYFTDEERKASARERKRRSREKEEIRMSEKEYNKRYYQEHRNEILERAAEWKKNNPDYDRNYYQEHKDERAEYNVKYRQEHKNKNAEQWSKYRTTKKGRSRILLGGYKARDRDKNRGECTLTAEWIMKNVLDSKCHYCGESDWMKLGCDRINNNLPHTPENCVCSCWDCNKKRNTTPYDEFMRMIGKIA